MKLIGLNIFFQIILVVLVCYPVYSQDSIPDLVSADSTIQNYIISSIEIEGNQKTRKGIIIRELSFKEGDILTLAELEMAFDESKNNLLKQPLFNYVTFDKIIKDNGLIAIKIIVEERWFIWPQLFIINNDRNFNSWWQTKDFSNLDYRLEVTQYNMLGLNHILRVELSYGYTRELTLSYKNIFLDKAQHHFLGVKGSYFQQKSVFYRTYNNKQESYLSEKDALTGKHLRLEYSFRPRHKSRHSLFFSYNYLLADDSLVKVNPNFLANQNSQNSYFEMRYQYVFDRRDSRSYPLTGNWIDINLVKTGLGIIPSQNINFFHIRATLKQFYKFSDNFYGAHSLSLKKTFENEQPHYFRQGLGFLDYLRGFEYYVIDGQDYYLLKNTIKYNLLPTKISYLKFIPIKKFKKIHYAFYLTAYFDIGIAHEKNDEHILNNTLSNKLLYSSGLGFDIASYYDNVIRFEYSINSLGERGFFIHFKTSI
ncbi:MAG: POTRA domain-containing protein [Bacteroidales bacterium]|nr:POTRA domain-containing protein [Bacteroidales bacterium]